MTCAACQANVEKTVRKINGVSECNVNLLSGEMTVSYDSPADADTICSEIAGIGYGANPERSAGTGKGKTQAKSKWEERKAREAEKESSLKFRMIFSLVLLVPLMYVSMGEMIGLPAPPFLSGEENIAVSAFTQFLISIPIIFANRKFFISGFKAFSKRVPNMDSLVAIGSSASLLYGIYSLYRILYAQGHMDMAAVHSYGHKLYFESAATILALVTLGKYLEARSTSKTSDALGKLTDLAPKTARILKDGKEIIIPAEELAQGDEIVIRPGDSIPADGFIIDGNGTLDESAITGESIPVFKKENDRVITASVNKNGSFVMKAKSVGENTTLSQIIRLVEDASNSKAPIARIADKVASVFVPAVMGIAAVTLIIWLIAGKDFEFALSSAVAVLVISCPCALGLATPVAITVSTGKAAEMGILIKSAEALENLHNADTVILDKTGTITSGKPAVTDVILLERFADEEEFLAEAAAVEFGSEHPLAKAVVEYAENKKITPKKAKKFVNAPGKGVSAEVDGKKIHAGNLSLMKEEKILEPKNVEIIEMAEKLSEEGKTPLFFARDKKIVGIIAEADKIREDSKKAVDRFKELGLNVIMLTGDNSRTARAIAEKAGITEVISDVLPQKKEEVIRKLREDGKKVIMAGDGINDAPALTRADIGIAVGSGTDIAADSADIVLIHDSLCDAAAAVNLSRQTIKNIKMNLFWAFFYNTLGIPIAAGALYPMFGITLNPMIGSLAMSLSSVCVVTNALRLRTFRDDIAYINNLKGDENAVEKTLKVDGMMCEHCVSHVKKALEGVAGVISADVSLENKTALCRLSGDVSDKALEDAVVGAGYTVVK